VTAMVHSGRDDAHQQQHHAGDHQRHADDGGDSPDDENDSEHSDDGAESEHVVDPPTAAADPLVWASSHARVLPVEQLHDVVVSRPLEGRVVLHRVPVQARPRCWLGGMGPELHARAMRDRTGVVVRGVVAREVSAEADVLREAHELSVRVEETGLWEPVSSSARLIR
jgi:hypothetical protein